MEEFDLFSDTAEKEDFEEEADGLEEDDEDGEEEEAKDDFDGETE